MGIDDEDDAPITPRSRRTPQVTGSYSVFRAESERLARELDDAALIMSKRLDHLSPRGAAKARAYAADFRALAERFGRWPTMTREQIAAERTTLVERFLLTANEAIELLESMPENPALGRVRRPR